MGGGEDGRGFDPRRREFFRTFGRQTVRSAGAVVAAADELRRAGGDAARELMDLEPEERGRPTEHQAAERSTVGVRPAETFRSAYRATDDGLTVLDQRELPGRVATINLRDPSEIASAMRRRVVNGGPVLGEICAYGMAHTVAAAAEGRDTDSIARSVRSAAETFCEARHDVRAISSAVERMSAHFGELIADVPMDVRELATAMRAEADRIASENALAHAALGSVAADAFAAVGESVTLLVHGDCGPLTFGLVGPLTSALQVVAARSVPIHVFVTEAAPSAEGAGRVASQLMQIDVPHTVIPDAAVAWVLAERRVDAAVIRADYVCANGDMASLIGSLNVAALAERVGVPVFAIAPPTAFDPSMPDGAALAAELRWPVADAALAPVAVRLDPGSDIVPAALVGRLLTAPSG